MAIFIKNDGLQAIKYSASAQEGTLEGNSQVEIIAAGWVTLNLDATSDTTYTIDMQDND